MFATPFVAGALLPGIPLFFRFANPRFPLPRSARADPPLSDLRNTESVAAALGVTDRRVRQLVEEGILGSPVDGLHDIVEARRRYDLYRAARDGQTGTAAWAEALDELELLAREAEAAAAAAEKKASRDTARNAAQAALRFTDWWRFVARCRSRTEEERLFVAGIIEANESALLAVAVAAGMKALGAKAITF